ncbi:hypothetical protein [Sphingomonas arenae]|uniref:hypothetical protein n=1 Tax=Sphingomonas arenae TaxID=2812555 RepID=UPI00196715C4|nr:hypothetical protein [Sphingomonas arenae]
MSSAPLRFLGVAIITWIGVRTAGQALALAPLAPIPVPPAVTPLPVEPQVDVADAGPPAQPWAYGAPPMQPVAYPYSVAVPMSVPSARPVRYAEAPPIYAPAPVVYPAAYPPFGGWPGQAPEMAATSPTTPVRTTPSFTPVMRKAFDRLSLTTWALLRQNQGIAAPVNGPTPLAPSGQLGQSQAGARLTWQIDRAFALNLRVSSPVHQQPGQKPAGEAALGVSWQPVQSVPVRLLAERRKAFGIGGGRNAFALLAEGGIYDHPLPWNFRLDGYAQAGIVGLQSRDMFADGGFAVSRPVNSRLALGGGVWGGVQPGLARLDVGPRASLWINPRIRAHLDYRLKLMGNAMPGSGPALTVGANF